MELRVKVGSGRDSGSRDFHAFRDWGDGGRTKRPLTCSWTLSRCAAVFMGDRGADIRPLRLPGSRGPVRRAPRGVPVPGRSAIFILRNLSQHTRLMNGFPRKNGAIGHPPSSARPRSSGHKPTITNLDHKATNSSSLTPPSVPWAPSPTSPSPDPSSSRTAPAPASQPRPRRSLLGRRRR